MIGLKGFAISSLSPICLLSQFHSFVGGLCKNSKELNLDVKNIFASSHLLSTSGDALTSA
jgi:hypothetical protein